MIRTRVLVGLISIPAAAGLGVAAINAAPASASSKSHTLSFTARQLHSVQSKTALEQTGRDLVAGKTIGFDVSACKFDFAAHVARCDVAVARPHGMLYAHVTVDVDNNVSNGRVTGGTRRYRGATGTVSTAPGSRQSDLKITIVWHK
jgi:hypothetical protein